jgi:FkbM family methyltransferase
MMRVLHKIYRRYLLAPDHPGKLPFSRWMGNLLLPREGSIFTLNDGIKMYLHPNDWIEFVLLRSGEYEPLTLRFLEMNIQHGQTVMLAGVNIGLHAIVAARTTGLEGRVIGVDPQPRSLYRAYKNIRLNDVEAQVMLIPAALGREKAIIPLADAPLENSATAKMTDSPDNICFGAYVESFPTLLSRVGIESLDLLLLDVEGFELQVLEGMQPESAPNLIVVEVNPGLLKSAGILEDAIYDRLSALGYACYTVNGAKAVPGSAVPEQNVVGVRRNQIAPKWA